MRRLSALSLLVLASATAACLAPSDSLDDDAFIGRQGPIINGAPDLEPAHSAVVALFINGRNAGMCTGTLITRDVVLTAAHCVDQARAEAVYIGFGTEVSYRGHDMEWIQASEKLVHPDYDDDWPAYDIALLRLSRPPPADVIPIPPLPASMRLTQADVGVELNFAGFGKTEVDDGGRLLAVKEKVSLVCESPNGCMWKGQAMAPQTLCYDQNPGGPCSGDSGGPAFLVIDGVEYVAGVTSYGDESCRLLGCSAKVDSFEDFIQPFLGTGNGGACSTDDECGSGFCVEGLCCDMACEGDCQTCRQSGREGYCTPFSDGTECDDGDLCSLQQGCLAGVCTPTEFVGCPAATECRPASTCEPTTGLCAGPSVADGTACTGGTCLAGDCVAPVEDGCGCSGAGAGGAALWALSLLLRRRR